MKAIPVPVRERILHLYDQGKSTADIAPVSVTAWQPCGGCASNSKPAGHSPPPTHLCGWKTLLTAARKTRLHQLLARRPDATLAELGAPFKRPTSTLDLWLQRLGLSCKKRCTPPSSRDPTWWNKDNSGISGGRECPPSDWCSWMKAGLTRK